MAAMTAPCPCGNTLASAAKAAKPQLMLFSACCGRYLDDFAATPAPDAEALMRSRYSAFVLGQLDYLLATWHASTRPVDLTLDAAAKWLGLEVRSHRVIYADHAEVEFIARYRFAREVGRWFYVDGDPL